MRELYKEALEHMTGSFDVLAGQLGAPSKITIDGQYVYRYKAKNVYVAILLKLARIITGLQAIYSLNKLGLIQEQAAVQRILDELSEDISYLSFAVIFDDFTERHTTFLNAFFEEEFEEGKTAAESSQKRPMVPRKHIQAYINKDRGSGDNPATGKEVSRTISKVYSGYVHAAAPHVMELYYGNPPKFNLYGAFSSPLYDDHVDDMINYFYRSILAVAFSAKAFGNERLFQKIFDYSKAFANKSGRESHLTPFKT